MGRGKVKILIFRVWNWIFLDVRFVWFGWLGICIVEIGKRVGLVNVCYFWLFLKNRENWKWFRNWCKGREVLCFLERKKKECGSFLNFWL